MLLFFPPSSFMSLSFFTPFPPFFQSYLLSSRPFLSLPPLYFPPSPCHRLQGQSQTAWFEKAKVEKAIHPVFSTRGVASEAGRHSAKGEWPLKEPFGEKKKEGGGKETVKISPAWIPRGGAENISSFHNKTAKSAKTTSLLKGEKGRKGREREKRGLIHSQEKKKDSLMTGRMAEQGLFRYYRRKQP